MALIKKLKPALTAVKNGFSEDITAVSIAYFGTLRDIKHYKVEYFLNSS